LDAGHAITSHLSSAALSPSALLLRSVIDLLQVVPESLLLELT